MTGAKLPSIRRCQVSGLLFGALVLIILGINFLVGYVENKMFASEAWAVATVLGGIAYMLLGDRSLEVVLLFALTVGILAVSLVHHRNDALWQYSGAQLKEAVPTAVLQRQTACVRAELGPLSLLNHEVIRYRQLGKALNACRERPTQRGEAPVLQAQQAVLAGGMPGLN